MKNIISRIAPVLIVLAIGVLVISGINSCQNSKREKEKVEKEKKTRIKQAISDIVATYNAVTDWESNLEKKFINMGGKVYTIQLEEALVRNDNTPILLYTSVEDITRQNDKYFVHFHSWARIGPDVHFILECKSDQVEKLMERPASFWEQYAVVALISVVQRPKFEPRAYSKDNEEAEILVESSGIFIAKGRCLDLLFVGDYEPVGSNTNE